MVTEKVIDHYYFHISNGGYTYETKEYRSKYNSINPQWELSISVSNHGLLHESLIQISSVDQIDVLTAMLANVRSRMLAQYGEAGKAEHSPLDPHRPVIVNTYKAKQVYSETVGDERNGGRELLGYNLVDEDGEVKGFLENKVKGRGNYGGCTLDGPEDQEKASNKDMGKTISHHRV